MDKATVFAKSAKGREALQANSRELSLNERRLLIMIDGKLSVETLHKECAFCSEIEATLDKLRRDGYIEGPGAAAAAAIPARALSPAAKAAIEEELVEFLGPIGTLLCEEELPQASSLDGALDKLAAQLEPAQAKQFRDKVFRRLGG